MKRWAICFISSCLLAAACTNGDGNSEDSASKEPAAAPTTQVVPATTAPPATVEAEDEAPEPEVEQTQELAWSPCGGIECATLTVPLDHDDPSAGELSVAVYRRQAEVADPIGSLVINYGGPGGESGEIFVGGAQFLSSAFAQRFDLVTFDPRGVGETGRLSCEVLLEDEELIEPFDLTDGLDEEVEDIVEYGADLEACSAGDPIRDHLSTTDTARDMELLRAALGDDQLTYLGYSYGTQLGWVYATLFPDRVRAMVLDGALPDDYFDDLEGGVEQLAAFERSFQYLVEVCSRQPDCLAREEGLDRRVERVAAALAADPIELDDGTLWGEFEFRFAILGTLYLEPSIIGPDVDIWIDQIDLDRDPSGLIAFDESGSDASTPGAFDAITCADDAVGPLDEATIEENLLAQFAASPTFGGAGFYPVCSLWTGERTPLPDLDTTGTPPLLVIGSTLDPATPYEDAVLLDQQLANSVLVTYVGAGHTIAGFSPCIDATVRAYLEALVLPGPADATCSPSVRYGIEVEDGDGGIDVLSLEPGGGADTAGMQPGDLIVAVDGVATPSLDELPRAAADTPAVFTVVRDGQEIEISVSPQRDPWT